MRLLRIVTRVEPAGVLAGSALDGAGAVDSPRPSNSTLDASAHTACDQPYELSAYSAKTCESFASIATSSIMGATSVARSPEYCGLGARDAHPEVAVSPSAPRPRQKWWLQLRVAAAHNLPRATGVGIWSCFCVVRLGKQEHRTSLRHGGGGIDLGWADDAWVNLQVHDRAQLLTIMLLAYDGAESRVIGSAKITPALAVMSHKFPGAPREGQACVQSSQVAEGCVETSRCLSLMGVNGRILYGRDATRYNNMRASVSGRVRASAAPASLRIFAPPPAQHTMTHNCLSCTRHAFIHAFIHFLLLLLRILLLSQPLRAARGMRVHVCVRFVSPLPPPPSPPPFPPPLE